MESRKVSVIFVLAALAAAGCASPERRTADLVAELDDIVTLWPGRYGGEAQLPGAGEPRPIFHEIAAIDAPQFGELVYAYTLRGDAVDGPVLQQKIFAFDTDPLRATNRMRAWVFAPDRLEPKFAATPVRWRQVAPADLMDFPDACAFVWRKQKTDFVGRVSSDVCEFDSRAFDQRVRPDMSYEVDAGALTWTETLLGESGDALVSTSGALRAERVGPVIDVRRTYYEIDGATVEEVRRDLYTNASVEDEGELRFARADWQVSWQTGAEETESGCAVTDVSTKVAVAYLLPRWSASGAAEPALRDEWDGFMGALLGHLLRHQQLAVDTANRIERELQDIGERASCDAVRDDADKIAARVIENARRREQQYDYTSRFGKTQGADFPQPSD
ncbi:MAG: DUF922 domain-containing protein [Gammaproteobacteria bacterium]